MFKLVGIFKYFTCLPTTLTKWMSFDFKFTFQGKNYWSYYGIKKNLMSRNKTNNLFEKKTRHLFWQNCTLVYSKIECFTITELNRSLLVFIMTLKNNMEFGKVLIIFLFFCENSCWLNHIILFIILLKSWVRNSSINSNSKNNKHIYIFFIKII